MRGNIAAAFAAILSARSFTLSSPTEQVRATQCDDSAPMASFAAYSWANNDGGGSGFAPFLASQVNQCVTSLDNGNHMIPGSNLTGACAVQPFTCYLYASDDCKGTVQATTEATESGSSGGPGHDITITNAGDYLQLLGGEDTCSEMALLWNPYGSEPPTQYGSLMCVGSC